MSTLERMLAVLQRSTQIGGKELSAYVQRATGASHPVLSKRRQSVRRASKNGLSPEPLEQRLALAIDGVLIQGGGIGPGPGPGGGGRVVISLQGGDDLYITQIAEKGLNGTVDSLLYADNSSFLNARKVEGISSYKDLYVSTGRQQVNTGVLPDNYPANLVAASDAAKLAEANRQVATPLFTDFSPIKSNAIQLVGGTIKLTQPSGERSEWQVSGTTIVSGPGYTSAPADSGDARPISIQATDGVFRVGWNKPTLGSLPVMQQVIYTWSDGFFRFRQEEFSISASAAKEPVLSLPDAQGKNLGVNPASLIGTMLIDGNPVEYSAESQNGTSGQAAATSSIYQLLFRTAGSGGAFAPSITLRGNANGPYQFFRTVSGTLDAASGQMRLQVPSGSSFLGPISCAATYAVWESSDTAASVTFYAGHTITNQVTVDLLPPGSTINVDSPISVSPSIANGSLSFYATNIHMNAQAQTQTQGLLNIGRSLFQIPTGQVAPVSLATASAQTSDGRVTNIPVSSSGAGYSAGAPPKVSISAPQSANASGKLTELRDGIVSAIRLDFGGTLYSKEPTVIITPPGQLNGTVARATAILDAPYTPPVGQAPASGGRVNGITLDNGGFGYTIAPSVTFAASGGGNDKGSGASATATIVGSVNKIILTDKGFGYTPGKEYDLSFRYTTTNAAIVTVGTVRTPVVTIKADTLGKLDETTINYKDRGAGIDLDNTTVVFPDAEPPNPQTARVATATAVVDPVTGRIIGITILDPGESYGASPTVTIEAPTPTFDALRPEARALNGQVSGVAFASGQGLTVEVTEADLVSGVFTNWNIVSRGNGYAVGDVVAVRKTGGPQAAYFQVMSVDISAGAQAVRLLSGGSGFKLGDRLVDQVGTSGRGFVGDIKKVGADYVVTPFQPKIDLTVQTTAARDAIEAIDRKAGMVVYVTNTQTKWTLEPDKVTWLDKEAKGYREGDIILVQVPDDSPARFSPAYLRVDTIADAQLGTIKSCSVVSAPSGGIPDGDYRHFTGIGATVFIRTTSNGVAPGSLLGNGAVTPITVGGEGYSIGDIFSVTPSGATTSNQSAVFRVTGTSDTGSLKGVVTSVTCLVSTDGFEAGKIARQPILADGFGYQVGSVESKGIGYRVGQLIELRNRFNSLDLRYLTVKAVDATGGVTEVIGTKPVSGDWFHAFTEPAGNGYSAAPAISIDNPYNVLGSTASAVSVLNPSGAVIGVYVTDVGTLYDSGASDNYLVVADNAARDSIPANNRRTGMVVFVSDTHKTYRLENNLTSWLNITVGVVSSAVKQRSSVENCAFNAQVGASEYWIKLADDAVTPQTRTELFVSSTGSLVKAVNAAGLNRAAIVTVFSDQGDIVCEGTIQADNQSYLMTSRRRDQLGGPFQFTTTSQASGVESGRIIGKNISVAMGNDLDTPDILSIDAVGSGSFNDRTAVNVVSLNTDIDSLRLRAATRAGQPLADPFPYAVSITESNAISIDALAASSGPMSFFAAGNLGFTAVCKTAGDLSLATEGKLTVSTNIETSKGRILLQADSDVSVLSGLAASGRVVDPTADDIVITSAAGSIVANSGLIKARNGIRLSQSNLVERFVSQLTTATAVIPAGTTTGNGAVTISLDVPRSLVASDINVRLRINHASVADLEATLISPAGRRYTLFNRNDLTGVDLIGTIFNTEAKLAIADGSSPYTGSYRPTDSLATLNGTNARGTWKLEIANSGSAAGSVGLFQIDISAALATDAGGRIAGTALYAADRLSIVATGNVGNRTALPPAGDFYLRTDVRELGGRVGGSLSIYEKDAIVVNNLRCPGIVTLRADGYDTKNSDGSWTPALQGTVIDANTLSTSAPNGSIDVGVNASNTIFIGNYATIAIPADTSTASQFAMRAAGNVRVRSLGGGARGELVVLDAPDAGGSARQVQYVLTGAQLTGVNAVYQAGVEGKVPSSVTPKAGLEAGFASLLANAKYGDRVLITSSSGDTRAGVYFVSGIVSGRVTKLSRAADSDTQSEMPTGTIIAYTSPATPGVRSFYRLSYDNSQPPNPAPKKFVGTFVITVTPLAITSSIGSDDASDQTRFVVSTIDGTNDRAGSLGRMLSLIQANLPDSGRLPGPGSLPLLQFSASLAGPIQLKQELPLITKPLSIDGSSRYSIPGTTPVSGSIVISGYDILTDRNGQPLARSSVVNGLSYKLPEAAVATSSLKNVSIGGFLNGAAIKVDSAATSGALSIDKVNLGFDPDGNRLSNRFGLQVTGTTSGVTLTNSKVAAATRAGVSISGQATKTTLFGNTIGLSSLDNATGIEAASTGVNAIGQAGSTKNVVQYSQYGIKLFSGSTTVVNTEITKNIFDGIQVLGGANQISTGKALSADSNQIHGNSQWGVNIVTKAGTDAASSIPYTGASLANQKISWNYLGASNFGKTVSANLLGNVAVNGTKAGAPYVFDTKTGLDTNGNQHGIVTVTTPGTGGGTGGGTGTGPKPPSGTGTASGGGGVTGKPPSVTPVKKPVAKPVKPAPVVRRVVAPVIRRR